MAITRVQANISSGTAATASPPAWSPATTAGNLLVLIGRATDTVNLTWTVDPAGYTKWVGDSLQYKNATPWNTYGVYWKIAAGSDATPGAFGYASGPTSSWLTYTYEFSAPGGWNSSAADVGSNSAASNVSVTSLASGSTAALAQANELAIAIQASGGGPSALTFSGGFTVDRPVGPGSGLWVAWQETAATTALATTASWTTSAVSGVRIVTFKTGGGAASARPHQQVVRRAWAGR